MERNISRVRSLVVEATAAAADPEAPAGEGDKNYLQIAKQVMTMIPDLPEDPKEAADVAQGIFKKLAKSKQLLQRAASFVSKPGKEKQILRKQMRAQ